MKKRKDNNKNGEPKQPTNAERCEIANELTEASHRLIDIAKSAIDIASKATTTVNDNARVIREIMIGNTDPLSAEELQMLAHDFPQWDISTGAHYGKAYKTFTRSLSDLSPTQLAARDTYLRFSDCENSDYTLAQIFGETYVSGDLGTFPHFTIKTEDAGPITVGNSWQVVTAEEYLQDQGLFEPIELSEKELAELSIADQRRMSA